MSFDLYPAIDLLGGRCVRLTQGDFERETNYDTDPLDVAHEFATAGTRWIHMVDLDAASSGEPHQLNRSVIGRIVAAMSGFDVQVQVGGGVRTVDRAYELYDAGVSRCVIGTAAIEKPKLVTQLTDAGCSVAVGLDVRGSEVAVQGWKKRTGVSIRDALKRLSGCGAEAVIVTQIQNDGMGLGSDLKGLAEVLDSSRRPPYLSVIASGGVGTLADIADLRDLRSPKGHSLAGAVVGKALHDGKVRIADAVVVAKGTGDQSAAVSDDDGVDTDSVNQ